MLKILGRVSSINVRKVLWTCDELGLSYTREDWGIGFASAQSAEFLAKNPNGLIPVIEDENGLLWESNTICRYLASKHGRVDLLPDISAMDAPASSYARARVEQWMDWQATELNPAWRYAFLALVRQDPAFNDPAQIAASVRQWNARMGILNRQLEATGAYVTGPVFTLADIVLGLSVNRWLQAPIAREPYPAIQTYYERLSERPAFAPYGPHGSA